MPQLHLYVPEETAEKLRKRAAGRNLSLSRYLAQIVEAELAAGWPDGYFEDVLGSVSDPDFRRPSQLPLEERAASDG